MLSREASSLHDIRHIHDVIMTSHSSMKKRIPPRLSSGGHHLVVSFFDWKCLQTYKYNLQIANRTNRSEQLVKIKL